VEEKVRGQVPWTRISYQPTFCAHCADAPCEAAATGGAIQRREDGLVLIDPAKAKGQRALADACPIGAIYYNDALDIPQKCTGCAHLLDNGWEVPRCVDACATDAILYLDEAEADLEGCTVLPELEGLGARVYYRNYPKRFIAGTLVDVAADEVSIGTEVVLRDAAGAEVAKTVTDEFGDFKFDQIEKAAYVVAASGLELAADVTEQDLSLGDIDIS
jgi:Fe-S-cluster-containing dehydrogenase component